MPLGIDQHPLVVIRSAWQQFSELMFGRRLAIHAPGDRKPVGATISCLRMAPAERSQNLAGKFRESLPAKIECGAKLTCAAFWTAAVATS
jgi:hypothetical protein